MLCSQTQDLTQVRRGLGRRIEWRTEVLWRACRKAQIFEEPEKCGCMNHVPHGTCVHVYISVGEVLRRIIAKAILRVTKTDIQDACGHIQKCSGVSSGIEAAVHAMQALYDDDTTEGILLIDAANAFNTLNREAALHNVKHVCPPLATVLTNSYLSPGRLFVAGGGEIASSEGTTQGDPLSMAFYALATVPLIQRLMKDHPAIRQIWYADDSGGAGRLLKLRAWLETVITLGKLYGYHVNVDKTVLLV